MVHWPPVVILFWWHRERTKKCTPLGCSAKFPWCVKFVFVQVWKLLKVWRLSGEEILSPLSILSGFLPPNYLYTLPASPTTNAFFFRKKLKLAHIWCADTNDLFWAKVSNRVSSSVLSVVPVLWESGYKFCVFFAQTKGPFFFFTKYLLIKLRIYT